MAAKDVFHDAVKQVLLMFPNIKLAIASMTLATLAKVAAPYNRCGHCAGISNGDRKLYFY